MAFYLFFAQGETHDKLYFSVFLAYIMELGTPKIMEEIEEHSLQQSTQLSNLHQRDPMSIESTIITYIITLFERGAWEICCTPGVQ